MTLQQLGERKTERYCSMCEILCDQREINQEISATPDNHVKGSLGLEFTGPSAALVSQKGKFVGQFDLFFKETSDVGMRTLARSPFQHTFVYRIVADGFAGAGIKAAMLAARGRENVGQTLQERTRLAADCSKLHTFLVRSQHGHRHCFYIASQLTVQWLMAPTYLVRHIRPQRPAVRRFLDDFDPTLRPVPRNLERDDPPSSPKSVLRNFSDGTGNDHQYDCVCLR